jgi:hypothetical protein
MASLCDDRDYYRHEGLMRELFALDIRRVAGDSLSCSERH